MKLSQVIDELVEERGMDRALLGKIICEGMEAAYAKRYPELPITVSHNKKTDELDIEIKKKVVATVHDEDLEISLRKARNIKENAQLDEEVAVRFEEPIGRIEILKAKQIIAAKIRDIEASAVYDEFVGKKGSVVLGTIHKCERAGVSVKIGEVSAFLPKSRSIPTDKCIVGYTIRAVLLDVLREPKNENQLILDRTSTEFVQRLFELEIPEVFEKLVEIKKIVRTAGYKTKVAVISHDKNIDPVGTCIGVGGVRIKPILKELGSEKIDVLVWTSSKEELVARCLKPAIVNRVEVANNTAQVWLDDEQRSIAIGKMGQNIALASQLAEVAITLMPSGASSEGQLQSMQKEAELDIELQDE
ncbi:MAG: transcription termination factor NusA [Candidatus Babeliales bacterium]